jgi:hypothetical protein
MVLFPYYYCFNLHVFMIPYRSYMIHDAHNTYNPNVNTLFKKKFWIFYFELNISTKLFSVISFRW